MAKENTNEEFWVRMSMTEITTQCRFATISYENVIRKSEKSTDYVFSSIHSFLSHSANISKMLKSRGTSGIVIGDILGVDSNSVIHTRKFRNHLEHYDERLKKWIDQFGINANIGINNIGPKDVIAIPSFVFISHYDPSMNIFTFIDDDFDLSLLHDEIIRIQGLTEKWLKS